ncbi:MAG: ABC transporter ATP-binding protein [Woeseia sp.]
MNLLEVGNLRIQYGDNAPAVVNDLSFSMAAGDSLAIVGESASGKTQTALGIMGLLPAHARVSGEVLFDGNNLLGRSDRFLNGFRARRIAMVFQDPKQALNPYLRIGNQLSRILLEQGIGERRNVVKRAHDLLRRVGLPDVERQYRSYAHQLSGGMRQRAMIAMALAGEPELLIADEPTTALDVTVQAQVLELLHELKDETGIALLLITHDLGVVAGNCKRMLVMQRGKMLEYGATEAVFRNPSHAHTRAMLAAVPRIGAPIAVAPLAGTAAPVLTIDGVSVQFADRAARASGPASRKGTLHALRPLTVGVRAGETLAIVGESGSGKSSLARAVLGLLTPATGTISFLGRPIAARVQSRANELRRNLQLVFQDPVASLNPAMRVWDVLLEPVRLHEPQLDAAGYRERIETMLERVGLDAPLLQRYAHELSGGQAQRVAIARALILEPRVLVCDEAVAALDGTVRQAILDLLRREQERSGMSLIFITHDLAVVRQISHRVLVMYMGRVCELADNAALFAQPRHPYTRALLDAVPVPEPGRERRRAGLRGEAASLLAPPAGCVFHPRCPLVTERCRQEVPLADPLQHHQAACHHPGPFPALPGSDLSN